MPESAIADRTAEVLETDPEAFQRRVEEDAETIKEELEAGTFDNPQGIVGLEYEFYAVRDRRSSARADTAAAEAFGSLTRMPRRLLELIGFEKELGLHNAEMSTSPQPMNRHGMDAQASEVKARLGAALNRLEAEGIRLVSDGIWTIPPAGERARGYLTDSVEDDGVVIATNMSDAARYHAMANSDTPARMRLDLPHVTLEADTVMPESLITSIQPHYQVAHAPDLPAYFRYAIRIAGPLLALGVNSPFVPPDLYDEGASPEAVLEDGWAEHRIPVFEDVLNAETHTKVRFPAEIDTIDDAVDRVVEDTTMVPMPVDRGNRFDDRFAHFRRKHGTFWRWIRPVLGGASRSTANARIEFRPLPGQPTVDDAIAFQAAFAALLEELHAHDHPVRSLGWEQARDNFYAAARDGLTAELTWITADGDRTTNPDRIYADLLDAAERGLRARGLNGAAIKRYLGPIRSRTRHAMTPARWKRRVVRDRLDRGADLRSAIEAMQRRYIERQTDTLLDRAFVDWLAADGTPA